MNPTPPGGPDGGSVLTLDERRRATARRKAAARRSGSGGPISALAKLLRFGAVRVDGVTYTPRRAMAPVRALDRGVELVYDVRFPTAHPMRIRLNPGRVYPDLVPTGREALYRVLGEHVRPGWRIADVACGAGDGAAHLSERAGPTGAVHAWDHDSESVRFARRRSARDNLTFEVGGVESLAIEFDATFNAVVVVAGQTTDDTPGVDTGPSDDEIGRAVAPLVAPGGWVAVLTPPHDADRGAQRSDPSRASGEILSRCARCWRVPAGESQALPAAPGWGGLWGGAMIRRPGRISCGE